jgi:YD repeat-containing protein
MRTSRVVLGAAVAFVAVAAAAPARALQGPTPGAASPDKLKLPDRPGSIKGLSDAANVNIFSGQVGYSVPFELPKGAAGFGPSVALTYSGELGDGPVGIGWTMGQMGIRRTLRYGVPTYTDADELELIGIGNGGKLIRDDNDPNTYWAFGQAKNIRVRKQGARFEVKDGDGTTYLLGTSINGRETDGAGKVSGWLVESITNLVGQQIRLTYDRDQGQTYLDSISWGPGAVTYRVDVTYHGRKDVSISYRTGYEVRTARLLTQMVVSEIENGHETIVRTMSLSYDESFAASRLHSVQLTGTPRNAPTQPAESLPVLTFEYARPSPSSKVALPGVDGWQLNTRGVSFLDVDGDGMSDLVRLELGNHQYRKNMGGSFSAPVTMSGASDVELADAQLMDLDGDARPELVRIVDDTWRAYKLENGSWQQLGLWPGSNGIPLHGTGVVLADLNGDGRTDVIRGAAGGILVTFNTKSGLAPTVRLPQISAAEAAIEPGNANVRFADFNGDGLADVEYLTDGWLKVFLGRGDGTFVVWNRIYWPWGEAAFDANDVQIVDLDRDGMMDLVHFAAGSVTCYPGMPNGHFADASAVRHLSRPENTEADVVVTTADVLGNGSQDVVWSSPRGLWALDLAGPATSGMLVNVNNGMGKTTRFTYKSSGLLAVEAEEQGSPWQVKLPSVIHVPIRMEIDLGDTEPLRVVHYGVRNGFWDGDERRFGGFLESTEQQLDDNDAAASLVTTTKYHAGLGDERVLRGMPVSVTRADGHGQTFDLAKTDWEAFVLPDMPKDPCARRAIKTQVTAENYEGVAEPVRTQTLYDNFDRFGRPGLETQNGIVEIGGDERVITRLFADDDVTWVRERTYEEKVTAPGGALVKWSRTYFGGPAGAPLGLGGIGQGFVRQVTGYLDTNNTWPVQTSTTYDNFGNPIDVYANGVHRTIGYDSGLFPNAETVVPDASRPASALTWGMTWDRVIGAPSTLTDPNLDYAYAEYDTLARIKKISENGTTPHSCFSYDWTAPHPQSTTWVFDGPTSALASEPCPTGPHWRQTLSVSNGAGEALFGATPAGDGSWIISGWKERDARGRVTLMVEPFSANTPQPTTFDGMARRQTFAYDALARLVLQTLPNMATKKIFYKAFYQRVESSELLPVESFLDGQNRITTTQRTEAGESVTAVYDAADRIRSMTLQDGTSHQFKYDTLGRMTFAQDPDTGPRTLQYDDRNFLVSHTNGEEQTVSFSYDDAGRLTRRAEPLGDYVYNYDDDGGFFSTACHEKARLAAVTEPGLDGTLGGVHFCYDTFGRQNVFDRTIVAAGGSRRGSETSEYSPSGLVLQSTSDDGFSIGYKYDAAGRAICARTPPADAAGKCQRLAAGQVGGGTDDYWVADIIDPAGRVRQEHYGNGATEVYGYDTLGLTNFVDLKSPVQSAPLFDITVTRNAYGAPTIVADGDGQGLDQSATYEYDGEARLKRATLGSAERLDQQYEFKFGYDPLQNMTFRSVKQGASAKDIGVLTGVYKYAERGYGPRQLTSVIPGATP